MKGEANSSIRKGKKLLFFELKVECKWEGKLIGPNGELVGNGDGDIVIPEFDQDSNLDDVEIKVLASDDGGKSDETLREAFIKHGGVKLFRRKLDEFLTELKAK